MSVFYNKDGDIKAITPTQNDFKDESCSVAFFSLSEIEPFLLGKKSLTDYIVKKEDEKFTLTKKFADISYTRTIDNYLTEIEDIEYQTTIISIINQKKDKVFILEFSKNFKLLYTDGSKEDKSIIDDILKNNSTSIFITKKHNPYYLQFKITFSPKELFQKDRLYFNYQDNIENASAYTKRIISGYGYRER